MDKFIVPPKLNRKHVVFGFTVWELFSLLALIIVFIFTANGFFCFAAACLVALSFRPQEEGGHRRNAGSMLVLLFRYFKSSQVYSLREVRD